MDHTLVSLDAISGQFLSENSEIPPDIIFKFCSASGDGADVVAAHKMILAMVSQIFRNMFYVHNTVDKSANEILIEDSNKPTFQMMIDAVYNVKPMKESLQGKSVDEMFAVLYLVTKYKISSLELAVKECLSSFTITEDNALDVADDAMEYLATFEEAAQSLLLSCAKLLKSKLTDNESFVRIVAENGDRMATVHKLALLIKDLPPPPPVPCSGCKRVPTECLHGEKVTHENVEIGVKVVRSPNYPEYRPNDSWGTGVVTKKDERNNDSWFIRWENNVENGDWAILNGSYFLFKCH